METNAEAIVRLHKDGLSEAQIVKQLGVTRHAVRTVVERDAVFEEGRQAGLKEARESFGSIEQVRASYGYRVPENSAFDEGLLAEIIACLREGKHIPEAQLREKFHVTHNVMYKYRAIAIDRVQCGRA